MNTFCRSIQFFIAKLYRCVWRPFLLKYRLTINRLRFWFAGVQYGKKLLVENNVDIDCGINVVLGEHVHIGTGVYLGVFSTGKLQIGSSTYIGRYSTILAHQGVCIGNDCLIAPQCFITDVNHGFRDGGIPIKSQAYESRKVVIGDDVWIGTGVIIVPGVTISKGSVIGAGAVVTKDIPAYSVAVGVPARVISKRGIS